MNGVVVIVAGMISIQDHGRTANNDAVAVLPTPGVPVNRTKGRLLVMALVPSIGTSSESLMLLFLAAASS